MEIDLTPLTQFTDDPKKKKKGKQKGYVIDLSVLENIPKPLKAPRPLNSTGEEAPHSKMVIAENRPQTDTPLTDFLETFIPPPPKEQGVKMQKPFVYKTPSFRAEDIERVNLIESEGRLETIQHLENAMNPIAILEQFDPKVIKQKIDNLKDYDKSIKLLLTGSLEEKMQWVATNPTITNIVDKWTDANNANILARETYDPQLRVLADAKQISALANTLFTPISLVFDVFNNIPIVGEPIVDVVMAEFNAATAITQLISPYINIFDNDKHNKEFQGILNEVIPIVALGFEGFAKGKGFTKEKGLTKKVTSELLSETLTKYKPILDNLAKDIRTNYLEYKKNPADKSAEFINKQLKLTQGEPYTKADWTIDNDGRIVKGKPAPEILDIKEYKEPPKMLPESDVKPEQPPKQLTQGEVYTPADYIIDADGRVVKSKGETSKPIIYNPFDKSVQMPEQLPKDMTFNKSDFVTDESGITRRSKPAFEPIDTKEYKEPPKMLPEGKTENKVETVPEVKGEGEVGNDDVDIAWKIDESELYDKIESLKNEKATIKTKYYNQYHKEFKGQEYSDKGVKYILSKEIKNKKGETEKYQYIPSLTEEQKQSAKNNNKIKQEIQDKAFEKLGDDTTSAINAIADSLEIKLKENKVKYRRNNSNDTTSVYFTIGDKKYRIADHKSLTDNNGGIMIEFKGNYGDEFNGVYVNDKKYKIEDIIKSEDINKEIIDTFIDKIKNEKKYESSPETEYQKAKKSFKDKTQGRMNMTFGLDAIPEAITIGKYHFNKGLKKFTDWSKQMLRELGRVVKPHLRTIWEKVNKGIEKTAEFFLDVKPGDTSGTLGTLGGVTGKGKRPVEVVIPKTEKQESLFSKKDRFVNNFLDRKKTIEAITNKAKEKDPNKRADVEAGNLSTVYTLIENNIGGKSGFMDIMQKDGNYKTYKGNVKTLEKMVGNNKNALDFGQYLAARKILADRREVTALQRLKEETLKQPETPKNKTLVKSLDKRIDQLSDILETNNFDEVQAQDIVTKNKDRFTGATRLYDDINQRLIELAENTQLISKEKAQQYRSNKDYTSFQRDMSEILGDKGEYISKNPASKLTATKERTGSESLDIVYPVYSQKNAIIETTSKGMRNVYLNKLWDSIQKDENLKDFMRLTETEGSNTISFRVKGERKVFELAPELKESIEALNPKALPTYLKVLSMCSNIFRRGTTVANPFFALRNIVVDAITSMAQSKTGLTPITTISNIVKLLVGDKATIENWNKYKRIGGERQTFAKSYETDPATFRSNMLGETSKLDKIYNIIDSGLSIAEIPSNFTEMITRFGEYDRAKKKGYSDTVALNWAGEVSIPFQNRGTKMRAATISLPYFGASLNALHKFSKSTIENPLRVGMVTTAVVISGLAATIGGFEVATEEQKRKLAQMPINLLARGYYIPMPDGKSLFRIRIPEQIGTVATAIQLAIYKGLGYRDTKLVDYFKALSNVIPSRLDATSPGEMVLSLLPKPLDVAVSLVTNTKTFPKLAPIVPKWMEQYKEGEQYFEYTTDISKSIGKYLGISPAKIDYALSNTIGDFPMFLYDAAGKFLTGQKEKIGEKALSKIGIAGQNDAYIMAGNIYDNFYETKEELDKLYLTSKNITKENMGKEQYNMYQAYTQLNEELSDLHTYHRTFKELPPKAQDAVWNTLIHLEDKTFDQLTTDIEKLSQVNDELIRSKIKSRNTKFDKEDFIDDIESKFEDYEAVIKGEEKSDKPFKQPKLKQSGNSFKRK